MNTTRSTLLSLAAIFAIAILALAACAPAPTAAPPTAAPAPTTAPTAVPPTTAPTTAPAAAPTTAPTSAPTTAPTSAPAATGASVSITVTLGPGRDGDQTPGSAVFTAQGDKTQVVLNLKSGGAGVSQPAHIHEGACPNVGAVKYPLTNVSDGTSTTIVNAPLASLLTDGYAVNVHKSTSEAGVYVACGGIPQGTVINLGPGRDGDQTPATAVLLAMGSQTQVIINMKSGGAGVSQPAHIHEGACPNVGAVKYPLTNVADGQSVTTVNAALSDLLKGGYAINVHKSTSQAGVYVACAAVK